MDYQVIEVKMPWVYDLFIPCQFNIPALQMGLFMGNDMGKLFFLRSGRNVNLGTKTPQHERGLNLLLHDP